MTMHGNFHWYIQICFVKYILSDWIVTRKKKDKMGNF